VTGDKRDTETSLVSRRTPLSAWGSVASEVEAGQFAPRLEDAVTRTDRRSVVALLVPVCRFAVEHVARVGWDVVRGPDACGETREGPESPEVTRHAPEVAGAARRDSRRELGQLGALDARAIMLSEGRDTLRDSLIGEIVALRK
jgi:hypothetical protein